MHAEAEGDSGGENFRLPQVMACCAPPKQYELDGHAEHVSDCGLPLLCTTSCPSGTSTRLVLMPGVAGSTGTLLAGLPSCWYVLSPQHTSANSLVTAQADPPLPASWIACCPACSCTLGMKSLSSFTASPQVVPPMVPQHLTWLLLRRAQVINVPTMTSRTSTLAPTLITGRLFPMDPTAAPMLSVEPPPSRPFAPSPQHRHCCELVTTQHTPE